MPSTSETMDSCLRSWMDDTFAVIALISVESSESASSLSGS
jgi:hypothetical protein